MRSWHWFDINYNVCHWLRLASGVICAVGLPRSPSSAGPTPARQSGNKEVDWEPLSVLFTNRNIPLRTVATVENPQYPQQTFISPLIVDILNPLITWHLPYFLGLREGYFFFSFAWSEVSGEGEAEHLIANKSINQPKSGKVCLVMSSDWSRRCSHHRVVRSKSFESWKTGFKLARRDFYQSQTQYLIFDCGKERGVICVLRRISNFGGGN